MISNNKKEVKINAWSSRNNALIEFYLHVIFFFFLFTLNLIVCLLFILKIDDLILSLHVI